MKIRVSAVPGELRRAVKRALDRPARSALLLTLREWLARIGYHNVPMYAAALAYYTLFSSIPLLVFLVSVGSYFLNAEHVEYVALQAFSALLPEAVSAVRLNVESLLRYRGVLSTVSALGTLWSASGMFTALERAINVVWEQTGTRSYWVRRLIGMAALIAMTSWVVVAGWVRSVWGVLQTALPFLQEAERFSAPWRTQAVLWASVTVLVALVYRFFPARAARWRTVAWVSAVVGLAWSLLREGFSWALRTGLLRYPIVYGSLWILLVPILWAYWSYLLLLMGAETVAFMEEHRGVHPRREHIRAR